MENSDIMPDNNSEKVIERRLVHECNKVGGWAIKLLPFNVNGLPDRLCLFPKGRLVFVEVKTTGEQQKPLQRVISSKLKNLGFRAEVVDTLEQVYDLVGEFK
jgi:hypothetical protein